MRGGKLVETGNRRQLLRTVDFIFRFRLPASAEEPYVPQKVTQATEAKPKCFEQDARERPEPWSR